MANRIRSWAELAPRLKAAAKRGDQKVLAARYDLTSDQISRYLSAVMSPDPVVANEIVRVGGGEWDRTTDPALMRRLPALTWLDLEA